jgi:hypothetical protein
MRQSSPVSNHQDIRLLEDDCPLIRLHQRRNKVEEIRADEKANFLKLSKSLSKLKKSAEMAS